MAARELELAEHGGYMALHRLHGQVEARGNLLVAVPARDQLQDLSLAGGEKVELRVGRNVTRPEGIEHEAGEPR